MDVWILSPVCYPAVFVFGYSPGTLEYPGQFPKLLWGCHLFVEDVFKKKILTRGSHPESPESLRGEVGCLVLGASALLNVYQGSVGKSDQGAVPGRVSAKSKSVCLP